MSNYQPKVYRDQGGDRQVISSGGTQKVESGGVIDASGAGAGGVLLPSATSGKGVLPLDITSLREIFTNDIGVAAAGAAQGSGGILASDTTPTLARVNGATDKALVVSWAASNVDEVQFPPVMMPPDLDETEDVTVHLLAAMGGATDTPTIDVQAFDGVGDTEMGGATAALSDTLAEVSVTLAAANISGHPTGFLNIALVPAAHGNDALNLYGAWIEYTRK